jgi:hypothetical protein
VKFINTYLQVQIELFQWNFKLTYPKFRQTEFGKGFNRNKQITAKTEFQDRLAEHLVKIITIQNNSIFNDSNGRLLPEGKRIV